MSMILSQILSQGQRDSHAFTKTQKKELSPGMAKMTKLIASLVPIGIMVN